MTRVRPTRPVALLPVVAHVTRRIGYGACTAVERLIREPLLSAPTGRQRARTRVAITSVVSR